MGNKTTLKTLKEQNRGFSFSVEDYILYILNNLEPDKSDKVKLNKVAFFAEFAYLYFKHQPLSNAKYAAIDNGPVIDGYNKILEQMSGSGKVIIDGYKVRPLVSSEGKIPDEVKSFIDPLIKKYSVFSNDELKALSHQTDSYLITTDNEKIMGKIIDKDLASLETFFEGNGNEDPELSEFPKINEENLIKYEPR